MERPRIIYVSHMMKLSSRRHLAVHCTILAALGGVSLAESTPPVGSLQPLPPPIAKSVNDSRAHLFVEDLLWPDWVQLCMCPVHACMICNSVGGRAARRLQCEATTPASVETLARQAKADSAYGLHTLDISYHSVSCLPQPACYAPSCFDVVEKAGYAHRFKTDLLLL